MTGNLFVYRDPAYETQAKANIAKGACAHCGLLKAEWPKSRGRQFRTCSPDCTVAHGGQLMPLTVADTRAKVFTRDSYTCRTCGRKMPASRLDAVPTSPDLSREALFDPLNFNTVCHNCNVAAHRRVKKATASLDIFVPDLKQSRLEVQ